MIFSLKEKKTAGGLRPPAVKRLDRSKRRAAVGGKEYRKSRNSYEHSGVPVCFDKTEQGRKTACRDGVRLGVFWYRPAGAGPFPPLYSAAAAPAQSRITRVHGEELAKRGYAYTLPVLPGDRRLGREWSPMSASLRMGRISSIGRLSFLGKIHRLLGLLLSGLHRLGHYRVLTDKVKSMLLSHYGTERFYLCLPERPFPARHPYGLGQGNAGRKIEADYLESCRFRPHKEVDEALWGGRLPWYRDWVTNTHRQDPYWNEGFWKFMADAPRKLQIPYALWKGGMTIIWAARCNPSKICLPKRRLTVNYWSAAGTMALVLCGRKEQNHLENNEVIQMLAWFEETLRQ